MCVIRHEDFDRVAARDRLGKAWQEQLVSLSTSRFVQDAGWSKRSVMFPEARSLVADYIKIVAASAD